MSDILEHAAGDAAVTLVKTWAGEAFVAYVQALYEAGTITEAIRRSLLIRAANALGGVSPMMFPKDALDFFAGVSRLAARARSRPERGRDGEPIWSVNEWLAFCRGARTFSHLGMFGVAIVNTVHEVEAMISDDFDAESIHNVLLGIDQQREAKNARREPNKVWYADQ